MGIKDFLKKEKDSEFRQDAPPSYAPSEDSDPEHAYGHTTNIHTGDALAAADGKSGTDSENYKTLGRWRACVLLITIEVGIGILSLPAALKTLGLIPGIIAILGLGSLTTYCGYILVQFYRRYPMVTNLVDCAYIISKPFGMFFAGAFMLNLVLICASANITMSVALNTLSDHALCTVAFMAFPHFVCWLLCLPRKFTFAAAMSWICTVSIVAAVLIVMIALGVAGPRTPPGFEVKIVLVGKPTFVEAVNAILNIAFSFAGTQSFLSVMAEMRDASRDFPPALYMQKSFEVVVYIIVACVIYGLSGDAVTSPALGSAAIIPAKVAYGVLIPSVLGTGLVIGLTAIKVRLSSYFQHCDIWLGTLLTRRIVHVCHHNAPNQAPRSKRPQHVHMGSVDWHRHILLDRHIHRVKRHPHLQLCTQHQRRNLHFVVHVRTYLFTLLLPELEDEV
jgi:amino acid transporter